MRKIPCLLSEDTGELNLPIVISIKYLLRLYLEFTPERIEFGDNVISLFGGQNANQ